MSNPGKSAWPAPGAFPFLSFPIPGMTAPTAPPAAPSGLDAGMDLLKNLWGAMPGSTQVPGFLVPTVDLDELDKRLADLRAAESWVEVNLNMLRATIQGLEVQRHTIAALKSLSTAPSFPPDVAATAPAGAASDAPAAPGVAAGQWLGFLQDQFAKVAQAAITATAPLAAGATAKKAPRRKAAVARKRAPKSG